MKIIFFEKSNWAKSVAILIQRNISGILESNGKCSILLTGGRSAEKVYREWGKLPEFLAMKGANFYFGDERCVCLEDPHCNYSMTMRTLFSRKKDALSSVFRIEGESASFREVANKYENILPNAIDVLLITVGDDGHIASLFRNDQALFDNVNRVVPVTSPMGPVNRITITPLVISQSKNIFVLAPGKEKADILLTLLKNGMDILKIPASLVMSGTWLVSSKLSFIE